MSKKCIIVVMIKLDREIESHFQAKCDEKKLVALNVQQEKKKTPDTACNQMNVIKRVLTSELCL